MHSEGRYAFVELRTSEMASAALQLSNQARRAPRGPLPLPSRGRAAPAGARLLGSLGTWLAQQRLVQPGIGFRES
jgi:hypothetical protein